MKIPDQYTPIEYLTGSMTIFERELKLLHWKPELPNLHEADVIHGWIVLAITPLVSVLLILPCISFYLTSRSLPDWLIPTLFVFIVIIVPILLTFVVSLYTVSATINFWHDHVQQDTLDLLRLTMPTDDALLANLRAVAEIIVWRGMRWEAAIRNGQGIVGSIVIWGFLLQWLAQRPSTVILVISATLWIVVWLRLYWREPLWRMRVLVAMSIAAACRTTDTNNTALEASGTALGLLLVQFGLVTLIGVGTLALLAVDGTGWAAIVWFVTGCFLTNRVARAGYGSLHDWFTRHTLATLQGADD